MTCLWCLGFEDGSCDICRGNRLCERVYYFIKKKIDFVVRFMDGGSCYGHGLDLGSYRLAAGNTFKTMFSSVNSGRLKKNICLNRDSIAIEFKYLNACSEFPSCLQRIRVSVCFNNSECKFSRAFLKVCIFFLFILDTRIPYPLSVRRISGPFLSRYR